MVIKYDWREISSCLYCFRQDNGLIVGMIHKVTHTDIYLAKVIIKNDEEVLGRYISQEHAKAALFVYLDIQSRTLLE